MVSLTEENRDINSLLRVALVEKEALERNLNKLKGNSEQKRVPLLHFARAGFGFMMGSGGSGEQPVVALESSAASSTGSKSDGSEGEEEVLSVVCLFSLFWGCVLIFSCTCASRFVDELN